MKKQLLVGTLAAAVMTGTTGSAFAENVGAGFDVSANVGLVSDYLWRGVSQSDNKGAIQGGVDVKHSGVYAGLWLSSLSAWFNGPSGYATHEEDFYIGYGLNVTEDIAIDVRYTQFMYPGASSANFDEIHAAVSAFGAALGTDYADNNSNGNSSTIHYYGSYGYTLPFGIGLSATYGEYDLKDAYFSNNTKYTYWNLGVSKKAIGINWALSYNDTDLNSDECSSLSGAITSSTSNSQDTCGEQFVLSATKSL